MVTKRVVTCQDTDLTNEVQLLFQLVPTREMVLRGRESLKNENAGTADDIHGSARAPDENGLLGASSPIIRYEQPMLLPQL